MRFLRVTTQLLKLSLVTILKYSTYKRQVSWENFLTLIFWHMIFDVFKFSISTMTNLNKIWLMSTYFLHYSKSLSHLLTAMCFYTLEVIFSRRNILTRGWRRLVLLLFLEGTMISRNHIMKLYHAAFIIIQTRKQHNNVYECIKQKYRF